jgi:hypothetical protein
MYYGAGRKAELIEMSGGGSKIESQECMSAL